MPTSSNSGKSWVTNQVNFLKNRIQINNVLDIGAGAGTYYNMYKSLIPNSIWTGVEVWNEYITEYDLRSKYDNLIQNDCRKINYDELGHFDVAFAGDILEHMNKEEAIQLADKLLNISSCLLISIPIVHMPQGPHAGNPYEIHVKDDWSDTEVKETFGNMIINSCVDQEIGVYLLSNNREFIEKYKKIKIAIYTICKNEQHHVERWAKSNTEADLRLVCDTGSSDNTVELLKNHNVQVVPITVSPWRFDIARNTALNLLPKDIDVCIWQDLDEELLPGWRYQLESHWQHDITCVNHRYRNNNNPWQWHSKIHARHNCHWTGAVHETLKWTIPEKEIYIDQLYLDEHQDVSKNRKGYFDLLLKKVEEGDHHWRTYYFLANEYQVNNDLYNAIETRIKSYEACKDGEIVSAYIAKNIAKNYSYLGDIKKAKHWFNISLSHGDERETWFSLAEFYHNQKDWEQTYICCKKCLSITEARNGFTYDSAAWGYLIYDIAALSAYYLGLHNIAYNYGLQAHKYAPNDERLKKNLEFYAESYYDQSNLIPFPPVLEIETSSNCNRTCGACMRNSNPDREKVDSWFNDNLMPMEKIKLIFDQAIEMGFKKDLGLSHYNEPLMDPRFVDILKLAKTYPFRNVFFHSNGDFLTQELAEEIDGLADWITFSIYADSPAKEKRQEQILSWFKDTEVRFTTGQLGLTHYGPSKDLDATINSVINLPCNEPRDRFIINHLGQMEFCCDDLGNNFGLGSVSETVHLRDLWFDSRFQKMMKQLGHEGGRKGLSYCESCPRPSKENFKAKNIKVIKYEQS